MVGLGLDGDATLRTAGTFPYLGREMIREEPNGEPIRLGLFFFPFGGTFICRFGGDEAEFLHCR